MKFVKAVIAVLVCAALLFATYMYVKGSNDAAGQPSQGSHGSAPSQNGASAGKGNGSQKQSDRQSGKRSGDGEDSQGKKAQQGKAASQTKSAQQSANVTSIRSQIAAITPLQDYIFTTGEIEPRTSVDVFPEIGGKIRDVFVSLGSFVKKGDLIAKIDPSSPGMQYALNPVHAPISGTVTTLPIKQGMTVSTGTKIATVGDVEHLQLTASVPERYVSSLRTGLKADVTLEAYQDIVFVATVIRVSPVVDSTSRTKEVTLEFDTSDMRINAGMFAKVKLYTDVYDGAVVIPSDAVIEKSNKKYIYIVNSDNTVSQREVSVGKTVDNVVQLLSGVSEGEKMVIEGMRVLGDGSAVKDITASSLTASGHDGVDK